MKFVKESLRVRARRRGEKIAVVTTVGLSCKKGKDDKIISDITGSKYNKTMVVAHNITREMSSFRIPGKQKTFTRKIIRDRNVNSKLINLSG